METIWNEINIDTNFITYKKFTQNNSQTNFKCRIIQNYRRKHNKIDMSFVVLTQHKKSNPERKNKGFCGLYKIKDFYCVKTSFKKIKRHNTTEKYICNHISNKDFVSKYTKNCNTTLLKLRKL